MATVFDVGKGFLDALLSDEDYEQEIKDRVDILHSSIQKDLEDLMKWISNPVYSPDHPFGNIMMKEAKNNFDNIKK